MSKEKGDIVYTSPLINNEGGVLSKTWREMLATTGLTHSIDWLVNKYISRSKGIKGMEKKTPTSLKNAILSPSMTWKMFLDLTFNLLNVDVMTITIQYKTKNGTNYVSTTIIPNPNNQKIESEVITSELKEVQEKKNE